MQRNPLISLIEKLAFDESKRDALKARVQTALIKVNDCKDASIHYDAMINTVEGCLNSELEIEQSMFIMAHELSHTVDPCNYHAGESKVSYNPWKFGKVLKYTDPLNYEKSLNEFPLKKIVLCQPVKIREKILLNTSTSERFNSLCGRPLSNEFFADQLGNYLFKQWLRESKVASLEKALQVVPKLFCPHRGKVGRLVI